MCSVFSAKYKLGHKYNVHGHVYLNNATCSSKACLFNLLRRNVRPMNDSEVMDLSVVYRAVYTTGRFGGI
jgi:hypothetical protein